MSVQIEKILDNLEPEFLEALKNPIIVKSISSSINDSQNDLININIICNNPEQYLKNVSTQINFIPPKELIESKEPYVINIRNDVNNYRKLYEKEAKQINKIIGNTIGSIRKIYPNIKNLQDSIKKYAENYSMSIQNMQIPILNKKIGLSQIDYEKFISDDRDNFLNDRDEIYKKIDIFFEDANKFFDKFSKITLLNQENIEKAIEEFLKLPKSVKELSESMSSAKLKFERSCKVFKDLKNKEKIDKSFQEFQKPINELNEMEKKIHEMKPSIIEGIMEEKKKEIQIMKDDLDEIENVLKNKSDEISTEINDIREKYGQKKEMFDEFTPAGLVDIETDNFCESVINETKKINEQIKIINESLKSNIEQIKKQSRLDLLFIMDITNSMDVYLDQVKEQFRAIINEIRNECAGIEIYMGFIGYRDFSDLDFGDSYINLELTNKYENVIQNIQFLKAEGGGDIPEDLCGALEYAKNKKWQGKSRFTILVTDSPCHGRKYYDETAENYDNYPDGDKLGRNIEDFIKELAEKEVSVFCLKISPSTDKMFKIFEDVYNSNKKPDSNNQFMADYSGENIYNIVTSNAIKTFRNRKPIKIEEE